jgi:hypothetical protein
VYLNVIAKRRQRGGPGPLGAVAPVEKKNALLVVIKNRTVQRQRYMAVNTAYSSIHVVVSIFAGKSYVTSIRM